MNLTPEQISAIQDKVNGMDLSRGVGDERSACSIAAINLALTGKLTDKIPACMSRVIGRWIIVVQDSMPDEMRNSQKWKSLLPFAAGTGKEFEAQRWSLILDWMWDILASLQPIADKYNFGKVWQNMIKNKTAAADSAALAAAYAALADADRAAALAAALYAANAAYAAIADAADDFWFKFNPCDLLEKLIRIS